MVKEGREGRVARLAGTHRSSQRRRLCSKRGAGMDADTRRRPQCFCQPRARDLWVGSHQDRDQFFHGCKACIPLFAVAVGVIQANLRDGPTLDTLPPGSVGAHFGAATYLFLCFRVVLVPCQ